VILVRSFIKASLRNVTAEFPLHAGGVLSF
jgi:hypothetical protein